MSSGSRRLSDETGESAVGDLVGEALLAELQLRIADETGRDIILGAVGLEMSHRNLALALNTDRASLSARFAELISMLREDPEMAAKLRDLRRAGRVENFLTLAVRLGLQRWFCAACGSFMVQSELGRPRRTCGSRCRVRLSRAKGKTSVSASVIDRPVGPVKLAPSSDLLLHQLRRPLDLGRRHDFARITGRQLYERAVVLLGFGCDIALTSADIAALDVEDVVRKAGGLEVRLFRKATRPTQYVTVAARCDQAICPAAALLAWKRHLAAAGHRSGPLFVRLHADPAKRMTGRQVAEIITRNTRLALKDRKLDHLKTSAPVRSLIE
ncbi:hypothetical protein ACQPZX_12555 [Actinoplanes sp. CA-142083]|uniref:hypothetical protein n=1 Tax=Actinoplanes sp. CA-142083 TaxID=3239903 RepID=UPI003D8A77D6